MLSIRQYFLIALFGCTSLQTGCETQPDPAPPTDSYDSTPADLHGREISTVTLMEFANQVGESLAEKVTTVPDIAKRDVRGIMYLGDIVNATRTPTGDFLLTRQVIQSDVVNSGIISQYFIVEYNPSKAESIREQFASPTGRDNVIDVEMAGEGGPARYDINDIFLLEGEMREAIRGGGQESQYVFEFRLVRGDGRIVTSDRITPKVAR